MIEEISTLRTNLKQSRHDYQELEGQVRELRSTENSSKVIASHRADFCAKRSLPSSTNLTLFPNNFLWQRRSPSEQQTS